MMGDTPLVAPAAALEEETPRRAPRSRKLPSRLRSPSPSPVTPMAKAPRCRTETPKDTKDSPALAQRASAPAVPAHTVKTSPAPSPSPDPEETGPGKRHRRPSTMYKPPEALTAEQAKAASASPPMPTPRTKNNARNAKSPAPQVRPAPKRATPEPLDRPEHAPATFTRHGERIVPPPRREAPRPADMSGIMSPKPVRTATGVWRPLPVTVDEEDDEDDEDEDEGDVVQRSADLAHQAWSIAVFGQPKPGAAVKSVVFASDHTWPPSAAPSNESDGEEDDFHRTMLHDPELDLLTHVPSPSQDGSDASDGVMTDGNVTTPASCAKEGSPLTSEPFGTRSPSVKQSSPDHAEVQSNAVFQHALPVPMRTTESAHAGALTLSLPYDALAAPTPLDTESRDPALDADGETPLTPIHTITVQELAERSAPKDKSASPAALAALIPPSLPSDAAPPVARESLHDAAPLFDASASATAPEPSAPEPAHWLDPTPSQMATHASLHLTMQEAQGDSDVDTYFSSPEEMMALTDLDLAWDSAHLRDEDKRAPHAKRARRADAKCAPARTETRRVPRLRSRAS